MKNVTKTNILFTFMVASYLLLIYIVRLIPADILNINIRLILPELIMLVPAFLYVTVLKPDNLGQINFSSPLLTNVIKIILFTFCVMPFITILNSISTIFVENHAANTMSYLTSNPLWLNILFIALIPAICEEYLFRGLLFHGYKRRNPLKAILMRLFIVWSYPYECQSVYLRICYGLYIVYACICYRHGAVVNDCTLYI